MQEANINPALRKSKKNHVQDVYKVRLILVNAGGLANMLSVDYKYCLSSGIIQAILVHNSKKK